MELIRLFARKSVNLFAKKAFMATFAKEAISMLFLSQVQFIHVPYASSHAFLLEIYFDL